MSKDPTEQVGYTYWRCQECDFDAVTRDDGDDRAPICPICAGDTGRDVPMHGRTARTTDVSVEGKDARKKLEKALSK